jgi:hypothetical protein
MTSTASNIATRWTRIGDIWKLTRNNRLLAIIEPAWSDHHCFLFMADSAGELSHDGTIGQRTARLRICLQLWFSRTGTTSTAVKETDQSPCSPRHVL